MSTPLPRSVAWLGYGGLIPFVALTAAFLLDHHHGLLWSDALIAYGAVILSFVGALHWAFAMTLPDLTAQQRTARFVWSVVPALLAWPALLVDATMASILLVPGFVAHYLDQGVAMNAFNRLPGFTRTPPGKERKVFRALPVILLVGTLVLALPSLFVRFFPWDGSETEVATRIMSFDIYVISLVVLHWTVVLTVGIAAFIVMVMKGPAYVADPYPLNEAETPDAPLKRGK
jgi:hypothetical protein